MCSVSNISGGKGQSEKTLEEWVGGYGKVTCDRLTFHQ